MQLNMTFTTRQNSPENQQQYESVKHRFGRQCQAIYDYLLKGNSITVSEASAGVCGVHIGDLRARIRDLRNAEVDIKDRKKDNGCKEYFIEVN